MPNIEGAISIPLGRGLFVPAAGPQKFAVIPAYQRKAAFHQADRSIEQIVRFPGAIRDTLFAEQRFGDSAIATASAASIERADSGAQPFPPLSGYLVKSRTRRAPIQCAPQPPGCIGSRF